MTAADFLCSCVCEEKLVLCSNVGLVVKRRSRGVEHRERVNYQVVGWESGAGGRWGEGTGVDVACGLVDRSRGPGKRSRPSPDIAVRITG